MSSLVPRPAIPPALGFFDSRSLSKSLSHLDGQTTLAVARVHARVEVEAAKVGAIATLANVAMQDVAQISLLEANICQALPHAAGRAQLIANTATMAIAGVLVNAERSLR